MAQRRTQPLSERTPVDQREIFRYRPQTEPMARPTVPSPEGVTGGQRVAQLGQALQGIVQGAGQFAQFRAQEDQYFEQEGARLAQAEEELPEDSPEAKIAGYMRVEGEADARRDFRTDTLEFARNNINADPDEFREGLEALVDEYVAGKSPEYTEGFLPQAREIQTNILNEYLETQHEQMIQNGLHNGIKIFEDDIERVLNRSESWEDVGKDLRKNLSDLQEHLMQFGISRDQVSESIMRHAGRMAERRGAPELLEFFDEPDDDGFRLSMKYPDLARGLKQRALQARDQQVSQREAKFEKKQEQMVEQIERDVTVALSEINHGLSQGTLTYDKVEDDLMELKREIVDKYRNPQENEYGIALDASTMESMLDGINDILELDGFATDSDQDIKANLLERLPELRTRRDWDEFMADLSDSKAYLTPEDYMGVYQQGLSRWTSMSDREVSRSSDYFNKRRRDVERILRQEMGGFFAAFDLEDQHENHRRAEYFNSEVRRRFYEAQEEHGYKVPIKEIDDILNEVKKDAKDEFPMKAGTTISPTGTKETRDRTETGTTPEETPEEDSPAEQLGVQESVAEDILELRRQMEGF